MYAKLAAAAALASTASAQVYQGFNYGASSTDGTAKQTNDFQQEFQTAQNLVGHQGFSSARLYTNIQAGTQNTPSAAFQAAINTKTSLLLGIWGSSGQATVDTEISALNAAIQQYGSALTDLIAGISVGSEDLYRNSPTGIAYGSDVGANPADIIGFINCVKGNMTSRSVTAPVGHVDTWTAWVNGSNSGVIDSSDFIGVDMYPYFQTNDSNGIDNGANLFYEALSATQGVSGGKPVWITETGWPVSGAQSGAAVCSVQNAQTYWKQVACPILGQISTWWYTLQDVTPSVPNPSFGIIGGPALSTTPLFDLSCNATSTTLPSNVTGSGPSSGSGTGTSTATATSASGSGVPGFTGGSYPGAPGSSTPGAPGSTSSGAPGSSYGSAPGSIPGSSSGSAPGAVPGSSSGSAPGSIPGSSSGSTPGSYGSIGSSGQGSSANGNTGSTGSSGSTPYGSNSTAPYGTSPYGSSPYGSSPTPGAGSGAGAYPGSSTSTAKPSSYTGAATANSPQVAILAGVMGLVALFA